jgi:murein DD-endopeptidase MepM/ murein hydrolase activator NlpD
LATLHNEHERVTPSPRLSRSRLSTPRRVLLVAGLLTGSLLGTHAATAAPGSVSQGGSVTEQIEQIEERLAAAEDTLERMTIEAEAAGEASRVADAALAEAQAVAAEAAQELEEVRAAVAQSEDDVAEVGRQAYMGSDDSFGDIALLLDADSPTELLQQAATLELLGDQRAAQLEELEAAEIREAQADAAAREAVAEQDRAAQAAAEAAAAASEQLVTARATYDQAAAEKAALEAELHAALARQGVANPSAAVAPPANLLSASSGAIAPTQGRVTSCYGPRWGTMHSGIDVAAPIGTPVYTPEAGVVLMAGTASGFGYAVAIQHGDGTITLYGHVNQYFVSAGQVVTAGQQIAEVGNRGQSTGPHLHFEVHTGGLYANRSNPTPWLSARGISLGGC